MCGSGMMVFLVLVSHVIPTTNDILDYMVHFASLKAIILQKLRIN